MANICVCVCFILSSVCLGKKSTISRATVLRMYIRKYEDVFFEITLQGIIKLIFVRRASISRMQNWVIR